MSNREIFDQWRDEKITTLLGGLNSDGDSELLPTDQLTRATNVIIRDNRLLRDTGYAAYRQAIRGNPRTIIEYVNPLTGGSVRLLITDLTVYIDSAIGAEWQYVSNGTETTLNTAEAGGSTALGVASIVGFADTDHIGIELDNGKMHMTQVSGAPAAGTINITSALPSAAAIGKAVVKAPSLVGLSTFHVIAEHLPWSDEVVFTNFSDNVKLYTHSDGLNGSVVDLTGTGLPANTKCRTLTVYDNSLILAGLVESGTVRRSRFRYSAKGDITVWEGLEAGNTDLLDGFDEIMQALKLGPYLIFYRKFGITRVSIGGAGRFQPDPVVPLIGVSSSLAAALMIDKHIVFGTDRFFWYQGGFSIEEVECPIKDSIWGKTGDLSTGVATGAMLTIPITKHNEVIFSYASSGATVTYPRFFANSGKWARRSFAGGNHRITGYGIFQTSPDILLCESVGDQIYRYDYSTNDDGGNSLVAFIETKDFAHPRFKLLHDFLIVGASGTGTLTVDYSVDKGISWTNLGSINLTATIDDFILYKQFECRTVRFRFSATTALRLSYLNMRYKYIAEY